MDGNNWRAAHAHAQIPGQVMGAEPVANGAMEDGDWRGQLQPESRQRIVNKIMETLKRHLPYSGQEGLQELKKIAVRFEEKIYLAATNQSDYLRKISMKMLTMETKSQNPDSMQPGGGNNSQDPDPSLQVENSSGGDWQEEVYQKMDGTNWRSAHAHVQIPGTVTGAELVANEAMEDSDWRGQLQPDSRQRIVNKIIETLKSHLPYSGQEGLQEHKKIAIRIEEKIYLTATSQSDYLRKISVRMLTLKTKSQNLDSMQPNGGNNSQDPGIE